jgi:alcohol dehydrogenase (NADP+)
MTVAYQLQSAGTHLSRTRIERRPLGPRDVQLDLKYCGICHSDLVAASDKLGGGMFPMVPGHEMVGLVSEVGTEVSGVSIGDAMGVGCIADSCRVCSSCESGDEHYCETGFTLSFNSKDRDGRANHGGYASDYVVDYDYLVPIPKGADLARMAPLLCGGITVYTPLKRFGVGPGTTLCVLGVGGLGHLAIQFASAMGARVLVASRSQAKRADAKRLGAELALDPDSDDVQAWLGQCDLILDTISNPHDLNQWFPLLRRGGKLCLLGVPTDQLSVFPALIVFGDRSLEGSLIGGIADTREMMQFAHTNGVAAEIELITPDEIEAAWHRLHDGDVQYRFVIDLEHLKDG